MAIPESIKQHKPTDFGSCEIRCISSHYYVYLTSSKWDPVRKKPVKCTGPAIGKISPTDGFIPNKRGMALLKKKGLIPASEPIVKNYGAYQVMLQLNPDVEKQLHEFFPDCFKEIETVALLRLVDGPGPKLMKPVYRSSYMSEICPDLHVSDEPVRKWIKQLGRMDAQIDAFMRASIPKGAKLLFDGTAFFAEFSDGLSTRGFNHEHSTRHQIRLLYIFDQATRKPVFYRVIQGSMVDKTAFIDTVRAAGCQECLAIADKGFYSVRNASALQKAGLTYILPLQHNSKLVDDKFLKQPGFDKFDGVFSYHGRAVYYKKTKLGKQGDLYLFLDTSHWLRDQGRFVEAAEKDVGEEPRDPMDVTKQPRLGIDAFISNLEATAEEVFRLYKDRWDIERCFDCLKNTVNPGPAYAHSDDAIRGWAFLNHISLLYFYGLMAAMRRLEIDKHYTPSDIIMLAKEVYAVKLPNDEKFTVAATQRKTQELLDKLGVSLLIS